MALNRVAGPRAVLIHEVVQLRLIFGVISFAAVMHAGYRPLLMLCVSLTAYHLQSLDNKGGCCLLLELSLTVMKN